MEAQWVWRGARDADSAGREDRAALLAKMKTMTSQCRLRATRMSGTFFRSRLCDCRDKSRRAAAPEGMVKIPEGDFLFKVQGIEIEGSE